MYREDAEDLGGIIINQLKYTAEENIDGTGFEGSSHEGTYKFTDEMILNKNGNYIIYNPLIEEIENFKGAVLVTQKINIQTPFPEWAFFRDNSIPQLGTLPNDEFKNKFIPSIFEKYKLIHDALELKDIDSIMPLFKERNMELDTAFYYEKGTYEKMLRASLQEEIDNNMLLTEIDVDHAQPYISLHGNLIKMGNSALIKFHDKEETIFNGYDIFFRKEGDDWIISR